MNRPYTFPHRSREAMIDYICSVGGRTGDWYGRDRYPLAFNVKAYPDLDRQDVYQRIKDNPTDFDMYPGEFAAFGTEVFDSVWAEYGNQLYDWGLEGAQEDVNDSDTWKCNWHGDFIPTEFSFVGRNNGHLVVDNWGGLRLKGQSESDLREMLEEREYEADGLTERFALSFDYIRRFYRFVRVWETDFTSKNATQNVEYHATWRFAYVLKDAMERYVASFDALPVAI